MDSDSNKDVESAINEVLEEMETQPPGQKFFQSFWIREKVRHTP